MTKARPKVLAIASAGGHFVQLLRLLPAFQDCDLLVATSQAALQDEVAKRSQEAGIRQPGFHLITEANRWQKARLIRSLLGITVLLLRHRPDVVITTGAAPGYIALRIARLLGSRTIWIDSIANADELSLSGTRIGPHADLWLTQWEHLAKSGGPEFKGSVL